jgi:transposase
MMSVEELRRVSVINRARDGLITQWKAAEVIGVSGRQVRRLIERVRKEGDRGVIHKLRGKPGNRRIEDKVKRRALELYSKKYWDFGPTFESREA